MPQFYDLFALGTASALGTQTFTFESRGFGCSLCPLPFLPPRSPPNTQRRCQGSQRKIIFFHNLQRVEVSAQEYLDLPAIRQTSSWSVGLASLWVSKANSLVSPEVKLCLTHFEPSIVASLYLTQTLPGRYCSWHFSLRIPVSNKDAQTQEHL